MNKLSIFSKPDEIDNYIKVKVKSMPAIGGKANSKRNAWTEDELQLRDAVIMGYITEQGLSKVKTAHQIMERWDIAFPTATTWVNEACKRFTASFKEEDVEHQRKIWLERCETILQEAIETRDKQNALKALDLIGKSMGIYKDNINLAGGDNPIKFDFQ